MHVFVMFHKRTGLGFLFGSTYKIGLSAGAFRPNLVYTKANLTDIVNYGGLRGVRIMPEFDIPGHAGWVFGHPEVRTNSVSGR